MALAGTQATYRPDAGFSGTDGFTFAAWDGSIDSNLATVTVTVTTPTCTPTVTATVPASATAGDSVSFAATLSASGCSGDPAYDWDYGDGSPHGTAAATTHVYSAAGSFTWRVTATIGGATASATGTVSIAAGPGSRTFLFFVARNAGANGTLWRTNLVVLNPSSAATTVTLVFTPEGGGAAVTRTIDLGAGAAKRYDDAIDELFGIRDGDSLGPVVARSDAPLAISTRVWNVSGAGSMGQSFEAVEAADCLASGSQALLPRLEGGSAFRTNLGVLNLGSGSTDVAVRFFDQNGAPLGTPLSIKVGPDGWSRANGVFDAAGLSPADYAWATLEIQAGPGPVWGYASIVDQVTGDPTTVPMKKR